MTMKTYTLRDAAVKLMKTMCEEDEFGYFIGGRPKGNPDVNMREFSVYGKDVYLPVGDYDCGGSIRKVYSRLGVDIGGATSTANMRACMCGDGKPFAAVAWREESYEMKPGDIALWENPNYNGVNEFGHVAMCVSPDFQLAEFYPRYDPVSQSYLTEDPSPGDDDEEGRVRPYYNYTGSADWRDGWTWCLALKDEYGNQFWSRYDEEASEVAPAGALVVMQEALNVRLGAFGLSAVLVTGSYDQQTQRGLVRLLQASNNYDYQAGLTVSGLIDAATIASVESNRIGPGYWMEGNDVWAVMAMLVGNGWPLDLTHWNFDSEAVEALVGHKPYHGLPTGAYCDGATLRSLAPAVSV